MPNPNVLLREVGLWSKEQIPSHSALTVLQHLAQPGNPRLYVEDKPDGGYASRTSNSEHAVGFGTRIDVYKLTCAGLLELDEETTRVCKSSIRAYRITDKGREALSQGAAMAAYEQLVRTEVPKILERLRRTVAE